MNDPESTTSQPDPCPSPHSAGIGEDTHADVVERDALRRIVGLSTERRDITEVEYRQVRLERVVLVGVWTDGDIEQAQRNLEELSRLAETAGAQVLEGVVQRRHHPDPGTFIGSGKVQALQEIVAVNEADTVIFDGELSAGQLQRLEKELDAKVVDRTWLILDIFAQHARSREGKAQVKLAQLDYLLPRLRGWGESLSRQAGGQGGGQGGGIGALRGPGETKLEIDRRRIRTQMARLRKNIATMAVAREVSRQRRRRSSQPSVAIVGYTNAGKSSLINRLTGAHVLVRDELFATLDPTVRRTATPDGRTYTVTDTVGFVRHLPTQLVEAFRSTLEEAVQADVLVHVVDGSDSDATRHVATVQSVLADIGAHDHPTVMVANKSDAVTPAQQLELEQSLAELVDGSNHSGASDLDDSVVWVSAHTGAGIDNLAERIAARLPFPGQEVDVVIPYTHAGLVSTVHEQGRVLDLEHRSDGTWVHAQVDPALAAKLAAAAVESVGHEPGPPIG